jgi:hypothetical protein
LTVKLGVFSLWKGQQAFHSRPARISFTEGAIMLDSTVRARSSSKNATERLIPTTPESLRSERSSGPVSRLITPDHWLKLKCAVAVRRRVNN